VITWRASVVEVIECSTIVSSQAKVPARENANVEQPYGKSAPDRGFQ
jgi:hypothetical protein